MLPARHPSVLALPGSLTALGPYFAVQTHEHRTPVEAPWLTLAGLLDSGELLGQRIDAVRCGLARAAGRPAEQIEFRVAASVAQMGLVARLISPAIGLAAVGGVGVRLNPDRSWWQPVLGGAYPLSLDAHALVEPSDRLLFELLDGPIRRLVDLTAAMSVSPTILWGNVAAAVHSASVMVARARPDAAERAFDTRAVFLEYSHLQNSYRGASPRVGEFHAVDPRSGRGMPPVSFQRRSCCLIYRIAGTPSSGYCGDCIHLEPVSSVLD